MKILRKVVLEGQAKSIWIDIFLTSIVTCTEQGSVLFTVMFMRDYPLNKQSRTGQ